MNTRFKKKKKYEHVYPLSQLTVCEKGFICVLFIFVVYCGC